MYFSCVVFCTVAVSLWYTTAGDFAVRSGSNDGDQFDQLYGSAILSKILAGRKVNVMLETHRKLNFEQDASCPTCESERATVQPTVRSTTSAITNISTSSTTSSQTTTTTSQTTSTTTSRPPITDLTLISLSGGNLYVPCDADFGYLPGFYDLVDVRQNHIDRLTTQLFTLVVMSCSYDCSNYLSVEEIDDRFGLYYDGQFDALDKSEGLTQVIQMYVYDTISSQSTNVISFSIRYEACGTTTAYSTPTTSYTTDTSTTSTGTSTTDISSTTSFSCPSAEGGSLGDLTLVSLSSTYILSHCGWSPFVAAYLDLIDNQNSHVDLANTQEIHAEITYTSTGHHTTYIEARPCTMILEYTGLYPVNSIDPVTQTLRVYAFDRTTSQRSNYLYFMMTNVPCSGPPGAPYQVAQPNPIAVNGNLPLTLVTSTHTYIDYPCNSPTQEAASFDLIDAGGNHVGLTSSQQLYAIVTSNTYNNDYCYIVAQPGTLKLGYTGSWVYQSIYVLTQTIKAFVYDSATMQKTNNVYFTVQYLSCLPVVATTQAQQTTTNPSAVTGSLALTLISLSSLNIQIQCGCFFYDVAYMDLVDSSGNHVDFSDSQELRTTVTTSSTGDYSTYVFVPPGTLTLGYACEWPGGQALSHLIQTVQIYVFDSVTMQSSNSVSYTVMYYACNPNPTSSTRIPTTVAG